MSVKKPWRRLSEEKDYINRIVDRNIYGSPRNIGDKIVETRINTGVEGGLGSWKPKNKHNEPDLPLID